MVGLASISEFTHGIEAVLERIRSGLLPVDSDIITTLLEARDHLAAMVEAEAAKSPIPPSRELTQRLASFCAGRHKVVPPNNLVPTRGRCIRSQRAVPPATAPARPETTIASVPAPGPPKRSYPETEPVAADASASPPPEREPISKAPKSKSPEGTIFSGSGDSKPAPTRRNARKMERAAVPPARTHSGQHDRRDR